MLQEALPDFSDASSRERSPPPGAYLGRADLRDALITRLHARSHGPQPLPCLRELCREVAQQADLNDHPDLGWPADLARLVDALCMDVHAGSNPTQLEHLLRLAPAGAALDAVPLRFLLRLVDDPHQGLLVRASGGQIALLRQLKRLLQERLDDPFGTDPDWQSVLDLILLHLAANGRIAPPEEHFINLAARAVAELDAASAVRWSWQAVAQRPSADGAHSAIALRQWQLGVLSELLRSLHPET